MRFKNSGSIAGVGIGVLLLSFFLAWLSHGFTSVAGWPGFLTAAVFALLLGGLAFVHLRGEELPTWLPWLVLGAVLFRLALGVFWFFGLPEWGYPTEQQQAGYIMYDPFMRDGQAWELAQSETPLIESFRGYSPYDQYGGMLYLSAWMYRTLGGGQHLPQLVLVITSAVSGIGVAYVWAFTRRMWGQKAAHWAALGLAVYPEAVLLGGAHMREAFTITLGAALGFVVVHYWQEKRKSDVAAFLLLLAVALAFSWAYVLLLSGVLSLFVFGLWAKKQAGTPLRRGQWAVLGIGGVAALAAAKFLWDVVAKMGEFQGFLTEGYSGMVQAIFSRTPEFLHTPFLMGYGLLRPLLPAAVIGKGESVLWRVLGIWRALGWTVVLALLAYATVLVIKKKGWFSPAGMLLWGIWLTALVASYRAGGDLWDNPRYRAGFAAFQLAVSAWALVEYQTHRDPLLRRVLVSAGLLLFWVMAWYVPRFTNVPWSAGKLEHTLGVGLVTVGMYLLWDWMHSQPQDGP